MASEFVKTLDSLALEVGATAWVEKTPGHIRVVDLISELVPGARFIHAIRSGPDVVASLYSVTRQFPDAWSGPWSLDQCIDRWNNAVLASLRFLNEPHHYVLHYEHLVEDPVVIINEVWRFLGLASASIDEGNRRSAFAQIALDSEPWKVHVLEEIQPRPRRFDSELLSETQRVEAMRRLLDLSDLALPCCSNHTPN